MKDSLTSFNREDFRQRYKGSYGFLLHEGKRRLVYIKEVANGQVVFKTASLGPDFFALADTKVEFEFLPVQRSWYNLGDKAGLLFRIPAKQYNRGISSSNTAFYTAEGGYCTGQRLSLEVLEKIFLTEAIDNTTRFFAQEDNFLVLSRAFCITGHVLHFFADAIGSYNNSSRTITLNSDVVLQELTDVIKRRQLPLTVKVAE